ncbi:Bug family tripartite tricarboxylate transporter substrate binding protein [Ramlibacter sp.]|uniref:Bug family tripartite tricarboxylate transporter substrate binding protein n=1 Tax=Ramlibacter sp. TaxID=1917967 RepID=UPI003D0F6474
MTKFALFLGALLLAVQPARAEWPERPVRLVVPFAAGGNIDVAARIAAEGLQKALGQTIVIDNRAGAGGLIASDHVASSPPDGYTVFIGGNGPLLFAPLVAGRTGFDWRQKFEAVGPLNFTPLVLQVRPSLGVKTMAEFVDLAKKKPLNMGSGGAGSTNHLLSELLQEIIPAKWTTAHYRGNAPVVTALLGGEIDFAIEQVSVALPLLRDGRTIPLAVSSRTRSPMLPAVPTLAEAGFKDFEGVTWTGFLVPAGTPKPVIARLSSALAKVLEDKGVQERMNAAGSVTQAMSPEAFADYLNRENAKWAPIVQRLNLKPN